MDTGKGIAKELVGALDKRNREVQFATKSYRELQPDERILLARDVFCNFNESAKLIGAIKTFVRVKDRPDVHIDGKIEFPTVKNNDPNDHIHSFKWTNELIVSARAADFSGYSKLDFIPLGKVKFISDRMASLHKNHQTYSLSDTAADEVMEIIDSAVINIFEAKEDIRLTMGRKALAAAAQSAMESDQTTTKTNKRSFLQKLRG